MREGASFAEAELNNILQIVGTLFVDGGSVRNQGSQTHRHGGQVLPHTVVQFAGQASSLFILGAHQLGGQLAKGGGALGDFRFQSFLVRP